MFMSYLVIIKSINDQSIFTVRVFSFEPHVETVLLHEKKFREFLIYTSY